MKKKIKIINSNKGQSLLEFILLLVVIFGLSLSMLKVVNANIANTWKKAAETITSTDPNNKTELVLR